MTWKYLCYLMLVLAVALAGCTFFSSPPEKHTGEDTAPVIPLPSGAPPSEEQAGQALPTRPFDLAKARWAEYKLIVYNDGQPSTSTVRLEYGSSSANGVKTQSIKRTITSDNAPSINVLGTGNLYNLRVYNAQNSISSNAIVPFDQLKKDDPVLSADDIANGPSGSESVVVPKGTFDCKKYLASFKGSDSTYWGAPGVPVPVKVYTACDGATLELVDWG
jgi:hypothetical protein